MPANVTPMMLQYAQLKEKYSDCLLFFRLGDFYEMFFEDALTASRELEITLTGRDCGMEQRAPMCGVPYHSVDGYINRLIKKGYKVAICEQLSDPALAKGLVERDVIRVITPGTVIEESMLQGEANNYIVSLCLDEGVCGLTSCDVSTGAFSVMELRSDAVEQELIEELARISPSEIITNEALFLRDLLVRRLEKSYYLQCFTAGNAYEPERAKAHLLRHFNVASLDGFGCANLPFAIAAAGGLLQYLEQTQKNALSHIRRIQVVRRSEYMLLDVPTRLNLELTRPLHYGGSKTATLLYLLNKTETAMGARLLHAWVDQPLQSIAKIDERLDAVGELAASPVLTGDVSKSLSNVYDIERLCSRIAYGSVTARDCVALKNSLCQLPRIGELLVHLKAAAFRRVADTLDPMEDIFLLLDRAIHPEPPLTMKEGGFIRDGYDPEVDELRGIATNGKDWLTRLEAGEREQTGIKNLKIGYNRVFGYYLEVTKSYQQLVPYYYVRKQTLANAERYVTPELKDLEAKLLGAQEKLIALEAKLFAGIREVLLACIQRLQQNAALLSELDVYQSFARVAAANHYCRPIIGDDGVIQITDGRHPVVERTLRDGFISNHTLLDMGKQRLQIITGPNMAGKSTYMRQVALITLMAHIGCFVPAAAAQICLVDRIFTRVGAADNLASGQSTFMVEMSEMANILNNASARSLLVLDEIGRGTSTFDGLSIAWAVLEHIADPAKCGAKTLFATHYHELTELEGRLPGVVNFRITVREVGEDIIFLRKVVRGGTDKSFGVQVARLAGLPDAVIQRAREILKELERHDLNRPPDPPAAADIEAEQITLFSPGNGQAAGDILDYLRGLDVNALTPMDALNALYDLHLRAKLK